MHGVALHEYVTVALAAFRRPALVLSVVRNGRFEGYPDSALSQGDYRLGAVHIAAESHAAYKVSHARFADRLDDGTELFLKPDAHGVIFVVAPRKLCGSVSRKAAAFPEFHLRSSLYTIKTFYPIERKKSKAIDKTA